MCSKWFCWAYYVLLLFSFSFFVFLRQKQIVRQRMFTSWIFMVMLTWTNRALLLAHPLNLRTTFCFFFSLSELSAPCTMNKDSCLLFYLFLLWLIVDWYTHFLFNRRLAWPHNFCQVQNCLTSVVQKETETHPIQLSPAHDATSVMCPKWFCRAYYLYCIPLLHFILISCSTTQYFI
jgi:hypothetical protein